MKNSILLKYPKNWGLNEGMVLDLAERALKSHGFTENVELSLWFVGREKAKALNIQYRNKNYIPQVLGFPLSQEKSPDSWVRLGDIVICTQKLKYEVQYQKSTLERVLAQWLSHGVDDLLK